MEQQQVRERAGRFVDALHALEAAEDESGGELDALTALFSDDARLTNAALNLSGGEERGGEGVRAFWSAYKRTVGPARSEFSQITVNEQAAGLFWTTQGDEDALRYEGASLLVFGEDGKIVFFHGYYDTRQLGRALGTE